MRLSLRRTMPSTISTPAPLGLLVRRWPERRRIVLGTAIVSLIGVLIAVMAVSDPSLGLAFVAVVPVVLASLEFGQRWGVVVAALAFGTVLLAAVSGRPEFSTVEIATPGPLTTAKRVLRLALGDGISTRDLPFDEVLPEVLEGRAEAGLLIHEGQLTYADAGLVKLLDLGVWWRDETGLPLPLGLVGIRRDVERRTDVSEVLHEAIVAGLEQRDRAMEYAMGFGRGIDAATADEFVSMYVNEITLDMGERGREAVARLLGRPAEFV